MNSKENKAHYQTFSKQWKDHLPFCMHFDWWNEVVVKDWEVLCIHNGNEVIGIWPLYIRQKGPWKIICNPPLTPYCGPFLIYPEEQKTERKIAFENKHYKEMINQCPDFALFDLNLPLYFKNSLEFHWNAFQDRKRFTYLIDLSIAEDQLWSNLKESTRRQVMKAQKTLKLKAHENFHQLEKNVQSSFEKQSRAYPISDPDLMQRLNNYVQKHDCGQLWTAYEENKAHASLLMLYDKDSAYYLMGGAESSLKNSGAMSLLIWKAILTAKEKGLSTFNTEGSTNPKIEPFLRGFGGELTAFSNLYQEGSKFFQFAKKLKP